MSFSHDNCFEAENARRCANLFHMTVTRENLGLNRYKADLWQLVDIAGETVGTMRSRNHSSAA